MRWWRFDELRAATLYEVICLREAVFVVEQDCPYQDADGQDPLALHLLCHDPQGLAAYLRVFAPGTQREQAVIGRVVVRADRRWDGLGHRLMTAGLEGVEARWPGATVHLSAQAHLRGWYEGLGFAVCGPGYDEDGIPHLPMERGPTQSSR